MGDYDYCLPPWVDPARDQSTLTFEAWEDAGGAVAAGAQAWLAAQHPDPSTWLRAAFIEAAHPGTDPARTEAALTEAQAHGQEHDWDERETFFAMCVRPTFNVLPPVAEAVLAYERAAPAVETPDWATARAATLALVLYREHGVNPASAVGIVANCERRVALWRATRLRRCLVYGFGLDPSVAAAVLTESRRRVAARQPRDPASDATHPQNAAVEWCVAMLTGTEQPLPQGVVPQRVARATEAQRSGAVVGAAPSDGCAAVRPGRQRAAGCDDAVGVELQPLNRDSVLMPELNDGDRVVPDDPLAAIAAWTAK